MQSKKNETLRTMKISTSNLSKLGGGKGKGSEGKLSSAKTQGIPHGKNVGIGSLGKKGKSPSKIPSMNLCALGHGKKAKFD